jgi:RNA polymerase sigma factor (sigma-70 family)
MPLQTPDRAGGSRVTLELRRVDRVPVGDAARLHTGYNPYAVRTASIPARLAAPRFRSKRLLALAGDERLVEQIRRGNEAAFEVAFERHGAGILGFCRHMLGSPEEAEDVVQHTFAAAFSELQREDRRAVALKPWLYAIARNRCVSLLRARRQHSSEEVDVPTVGLAEQVERRAELRELLRDLLELPEDQREALLLSEAGDLSHAEVAQILGCRTAKVKALVFRARSALIQRREARETPCEAIREQLADVRGGALRRGALRHHLRACPGCRAYREAVRRQRRMLAAALPVAPSLVLKSSVLGAAGVGGGSAGGGLAAGLAGFGASASPPLGGATAAKVALVGVIAAGGAVAGKATLDDGPQPRSGVRTPVAVQPRKAEPPAAAVAPQRPTTPEATNGGSTGGREAGRAAERANGAGPVGSEPAAGSRETEGRPGARAPATGKASAPPPGQPRAVGGLRRGHGQRNGHEKRGGAAPGGGPVEAPPVPKPGGRGPIEAPHSRKPGGRGAIEAPHAPKPRGRGPIEAPPAAAPVRRGPPEPKPGAAPSVKPKPAPGPALGPRAPAAKPASPAASRPVSPPPGQGKDRGGKAGSGG